MKKTLLIGGVAAAFLSNLSFASDGASMEAVFSQLQEQGATAQEIILELVNSGANLEAATAYSVGNAPSIGQAISFARAGVCMSPDADSARGVAAGAVESASEQASNAVQASVSSALASFASGGCQLLGNENYEGSEPFATSSGDGGSGSVAGGGAGDPPADPAPPPDDVSPSQ